MGFDINAIKAKLAQLNGERKQGGGGEGRIEYFKPDVRDEPYRVRIIPWKGQDPSEPFIERSFYYLPNQPQMLAPSQFGKPDPVADLRMKLFQAKDAAAGKKLFPKTYAYAKVIVRGEEDKGVRVWKFTPFVHKQLLGFYADEDYGDITDLSNGFDLKVKVSQPAGKQYADTSIIPGKQGPASSDEALMTSWFDQKIDVDDFHRKAFKETHEIEAIIENWLTNGAVTEGTPKGTGDDDKGDALDNLTRELGVSSKPERAKPKTEEKKVAEPVKAKKPTVVDEDDDDGEAVPDKAAQSLNDAFSELMND